MASRADPAIRPSLTRGRSEFIYFPGMIRIPEGSSPDFKNKSWTIAAEVTIPQGGANGVLGTIGGRYGGWALLVLDGKPMFAYALSNQPQHKYRVASDTTADCASSPDLVGQQVTFARKPHAHGSNAGESGAGPRYRLAARVGESLLRRLVSTA
jgi:hypothetical protein